MPASTRTAVVRALQRLRRENGYSNMVLDGLLSRGEIPPQDQAFASRLFYGVLERQMTLDYVLGSCSSQPLRRCHPVVLDTLRAGSYQLLFMDKIPPSAAVNEAVRCAKALKQGHASGFVNGVLRQVSRRGRELLEGLPEGEEGDEIRYSCPGELISMWKEDYGQAVTYGLLGSLNETPDAVLRVNTLLTTPDVFAQTLQNYGINYQTCRNLPACFRLKCSSLLKNLESEATNWYYYQDIASQWACLAFGARPGERVADVCAAPGGKSFTVAQDMENRGELMSGDIHAFKCEDMERRARALGIQILQTGVRDAGTPCPGEWRQSFDRVMCDVPCSGLGVIRRRPEIRYKPLASLNGLPELQYTILRQSAEMVRPGGVLQYSTCTLRREENEQVVTRFLRENPQFSPRILPISACFDAAGAPPHWYITLFPHIHQTDGFFIAGFIRNEVDA